MQVGRDGACNRERQDTDNLNLLPSWVYLFSEFLTDLLLRLSISR